MTTQIDWQRELDASFGSGEDRPAGHYVDAGHRAVRRRRLTAALAGLGTAAVVAGVAWATLPGGSPSSSEAPLATEPSATSTASPGPRPTEDPAGATPPWGAGEPPARVGSAGLQLRPAAVVHERRDDLFPGKDTESVALDISRAGQRWWMVLEWDVDGSGGFTSTRPEDGLFATFDAFVRAEVATGGMTSEPASEDDAWIGGLVQWDGGEVRTRDGVTVVRTVEQPVADGPSVGLVLRSGGELTWMLVTDGGAGSTWTQESGSGWNTFDEWLADQVALADGGRAPEPVRLDGDGSVVAARAGVEVLDQQADPDLRAYGTEAAGAESAVARIAWKDEEWFVLLIDGSVTTVGVDKARGAQTLDDFVAFMADQADEGGMR